MRCGLCCSARTTRVWIWKAYDRATGRLVDWECGDRDERTFRRLFDHLARWKVRLFCSDRYVVYPLVLAVGAHHQSKGETVTLERNNGQQRHWTATLRRRSIVVSKFLAMINAGSPSSPICTSTRMQTLRCTDCRSRMTCSSLSTKMRH
jgi:IS1 family transposase